MACSSYCTVVSPLFELFSAFCNKGGTFSRPFVYPPAIECSISLVERTADPIVLQKVHSPNLSSSALCRKTGSWSICTVLQTQSAAGGERLGEWTFCKTMGFAVRSTSDIYSLPPAVATACTSQASNKKTTMFRIVFRHVYKQVHVYFRL